MLLKYLNRHKKAFNSGVMSSISFGVMNRQEENSWLRIYQF